VETAPFTAPELIENAKKTKKSDVYSFAMVMVEFTLPERSHPWEGEISSCELIYHHVRKGKRPSIDPEKLKDLTANDQVKWLSLLKKCHSQCPDDRPSMVEVCEKLDDMELHGGNKNCVVISDEMAHTEIQHADIPLDVHQGSVAESVVDIAASLALNGNIDPSIEHDLASNIRQYDGSNGCAFFSLKIIDKLYCRQSLADDRQQFKSMVEHVITTLPTQINEKRDTTCYYNVDEAYEILHNNGILENHFKFEELITDQLCSDKAKKRSNLFEALLCLTKTNAIALGVYTCSPYCIVVGFIRGKFVIADTHCVETAIGGNGKALIRVVHCDTEDPNTISEGCEHVLKWLERRMGETRGPETLLHAIVDSQKNSTDESEGSIDNTYIEIDDEFLITLSDDEQLLSLLDEDNIEMLDIDKVGMPNSLQLKTSKQEHQTTIATTLIHTNYLTSFLQCSRMSYSSGKDTLQHLDLQL